MRAYSMFHHPYASQLSFNIIKAIHFSIRKHKDQKGTRMIFYKELFFFFFLGNCRNRMKFRSAWEGEKDGVAELTRKKIQCVALRTMITCPSV